MVLSPSGAQSASQPWSETRIEDLRPGIDTVEDRALILTPAALYRFQPESEAWTVTTPAEGLPDLPLGSLSPTAESIWICGDGASVSDVRFDDWQRYGPGEGYPGRRIFDVEADEDYAYAGTDEGAARFDQYVLEWETLDGPGGAPLGSVADVAVGEERVWFGLDGGVAEYRKEAESVRIDSALGSLQAPRVLALRQTTRFLWAFTDAGLARYDKDLESWTSFQPGVDFPDARVHQLSLEGDDLWLGTDDGLWRYRADSGIWRRDESGDEMPGERVLAFVLETGRIWVATERAFAVYEQDEARWIDFTSSVPLPPDDLIEMYWTGETLLFLGRDRIVYGLAFGQENPSLFTYRTRPIQEIGAGSTESPSSGWRLGLGEAGLGVRTSSGSTLNLKGGATIFIEDDDTGRAPGLGEMVSDTRLDLTLSGRLGEDRTLSGFYDTTDPENSAYQLTYRGARSDVLRVASVGEIDQQIFNSSLTPGTGIRGGWVRAELGGRSEVTRRRLLTADAWVGKRRTRPGRDTFYGGNRTVEASLRDIDYVQGTVFPIPQGWTAEDLRRSSVYRDDLIDSTNDANTEERMLAGHAGEWDQLSPNADYVLGSRGGHMILTTPLASGQMLVAVRAPDGDEADLADLRLRNHYWIATDPIPGSLQVAVVDSTGSATSGPGTPYIQTFGLDVDGDGRLDSNRFSPVTGLLSFPDDLPFPAEVYSQDAPMNLYTLEYSYRATLSTFRLSHGDLVPGSERITVDREPLRPDVDYSIIPASGLFIFFEHVLLDDDTVIEVEYLYETREGSSSSEDQVEDTVVAGQLGLAPGDHVFLGMNTARWTDKDTGAGTRTTTNLNARLEWKDERRFLRVMPEVAVSRGGGSGAAPDDNDGKGAASGIGLQGRYRGLEVSASHRNLDGGFVSFEDRRTLLGRLREESVARGRLNLGRHLQAELEWEKSRSDRLYEDGGFTEGRVSSASEIGDESSLMASVRVLRSGLPNLQFRRGRVVLDAAGRRQEKRISRGELELSPDQAGVVLPGIRRLWLRAFFQRSDRENSVSGVAGDSLGAEKAGRQTTDHAFARLNGSMGSPFSWNVAVEDRRTRDPDSEETRNLRRFQKIDATFHSQAHSSVDAFLRWESSRDLFRHPEGIGGGFDVERLMTATLQLYPGRLVEDFSPLTFRVDLGRSEMEEGEPGLELPGSSSLWSESCEASERQRARNRVFETRIQILSWLRLVERWETESGRFTREDLMTEGGNRRLENRVEVAPPGGLVILRLIGEESDEGTVAGEKRRFSGQWDQTWGGGILTYVSLEAHREESEDRLVGDLEEMWNPQVQITCRRSRWQMDASLAGSLNWTRTKDTSRGSAGDWVQNRNQSLTASLNIHPYKILSLKLEYLVNRSEIPLPAAGGLWETDHDVRVRVQVRA